MIRIRMELVSANGGSVTDLGTAEISNIGGTHEHGNYLVRLFKGAKFSRNAGAPYKLGRVVNFHRTRDNPWRLLQFAIESALSGVEQNMIGKSH